MRRDRMTKGDRVLVVGGRHKGRLGRLGNVPAPKTKSGTGFRGMNFGKVTVHLDGGAVVEVMPGWLDAIEEGAAHV